MTKLSFVIPCYRSEATVRDVYNEIVDTVRTDNEYSYEIVAVNDSSPDNVLEVLLSIAEVDPNFKVVDCARNMGKHAALMAGFRYAKGDIIVCVDDDCQCPVDQLWRLLEPLEEGYDVSMAQYGKKAQSWKKNIGSWGNDMMMTYMLGKPKDFQFANFAAIKRFVVDEMIRYDNPYSYVNGLILRSTDKYVNVPMQERERLSGTGGYTLRKSLALWINGFTAFSIKPLRIAIVLGALSIMVGLVSGLVDIIRHVVSTETFASTMSVLSAIFFVGGLIMLMLGLLGEYVGRIYMSINNSPQYIVRNTWNIDEL